MIVSFTCGGYPGCPSINTGTRRDKYYYTRHHGNVAFTSKDMLNPEIWVEVNNDDQ